LIARLTGHRRRVTSVVVEPDGDIAYSASGNNVYRWSLENAVQSGKSQGHKDLVRKVTASVDGRVGISAADDDTVAVWDLRGSQPALAHRIENRKVQQFCVSSDAQIMFFADDGNTVKRASVRNGSEGTLLTLTNTRVTALLSSENDDMLFIGCDDGTILAWDLCQDSEIWRVTDAHYDDISGLTLTNQSEWLISAGDDFALRGWRTTDGARIVEMQNSSGVPDVAAARHGRVVAAGTHYGRVHVWDEGKPE
jgi:WD40 repeat protein